MFFLLPDFKSRGHPNRRPIGSFRLNFEWNTLSYFKKKRIEYFFSKGLSLKWIKYSQNEPPNVFDDACAVISGPRGRPWSAVVSIGQPAKFELLFLWITKITSYLNGSPSWIMMNFHKIVSFLKKNDMFARPKNLIFKSNWISISEIKFSIDIILI